MPRLGRLAGGGLSLLPGALTVYISFNAGGFFVGTPALVTVIVAAVLLLWILLALDPFAAINRRLAIVAGALGLFAVWTLISSAWSDSPARALVAFDRALLYLMALVLYGLVGGGPARERAIVRGVALGGTIVCLAGLITRILPKVWSVSPGFQGNRLSYPLTYWNALGILTAITIVLCIYLSSASREKPVVRVLGAAAVPILGATLVFTYSRGGIVATAIGVVLFLAIARPRGAISAAVAIVPPTTVAVLVAYNADLLARADRSSDAAISQGHKVALVVALCAAGAAGLRALMLRFDASKVHLLATRQARRIAAVGAVVLAALVVVLAFASFDLTSRVHTQYDRFVKESTIPVTRDPRARLTSPGNNGRLAIWDVALDSFSAHPLDGNGANTFRLLWNMNRPQPTVINNAHSLYLEVLGELGIPGLLLLVVAFLAILAAAISRVRAREDRTVYAAVLTAAIVWMLHAGVDWDWQVPAVTLWLFAMAGVALASPPRVGAETIRERGRSPWLRVCVAIGVTVVAITPALMGLSQKRLNDSVAAFDRGDCGKAIDSGLSSISAIGSRPEPWEIVGYCDIRLGAGSLAVHAMRNAVDRDPNDWEFRYGLAIVSAQAGVDPRPAARKAVELSPREPLANQAVAMFASGSQRSWARRARRAPLDVP
jgi:O-antigen ligase